MSIVNLGGLSRAMIRPTDLGGPAGTPNEGFVVMQTKDAHGEPVMHGELAIFGGPRCAERAERYGRARFTFMDRALPADPLSMNLGLTGLSFDRRGSG